MLSGATFLAAVTSLALAVSPAGVRAEEAAVVALDAARVQQEFEDCCSGTEPTVYATIALVTAGLSCLCCCVGAAADDTDIKEGILFLVGPIVVPRYCSSTVAFGSDALQRTPASREHTV